MKNLIILFCLTFLFISCSSNNDKPIIKETGNIINDYANTLESNIQNSKEVKQLIENNQNKLLEDINSVR